MQIGTVVRYKRELPSDPIGLVIDIDLDNPFKPVLVRWSTGARQWRHPSILEDICE
jgi:hypothetical protein